MLPVQFGINAQLATWVGSPVRATFVSFAVGALVLLAAVLVFARDWPGSDKVGDAPWWVWVGGLFGAFYVLGSVVTAPKLGAAALFAFILAGQAAASLAVDHFGWVGFDENPLTPGRLVGMALVAAGVAAVRFL
jgi:transporter family-2 protein